ncbi:glycosyltransferase family 8 protein [Pectinatus haikarae]|uniref:Lipopolysaccharide biosynthesis glycosyltransferase n=2 Tax=Pectinatus haikarae TaxID=349096 RepID=A0ABT9Y6J7_9FIRM|nr:glycosyltransferase [Pectinatus haikarae]MDQ0203453.1 lipopolysaccharide biosynthesis glycosyltransferase [Pectinatus haikarae]
MLTDTLCNKYDHLFSKSKENIVHIGYGIDDNYMRCTAASVLSICRHNPNLHLRFHILTSTLSADNKKKLRNLAELIQTDIVLYEIDTSFFNTLPTFVHLPVSTYFRFILPSILNEEERVCYLDADIICLSSIEYIFSCNLENAIAAAVPDLEWMNKKRCSALSLKEHTYFNAGMLIINIKEWNSFHVMDKVLALFKNDPVRFRYLDQDALNIALHNKIIYLPKRYNCIDSFAEDKEKIVFLHFAAHPKPWNIAWPISRASTVFRKDLYAQYEKETPWADMPLQMPLNYKEMKVYAKALLYSGQKVNSLKWYCKYLYKKLRR